MATNGQNHWPPPGRTNGHQWAEPLAATGQNPLTLDKRERACGVLPPTGTIAEGVVVLWLLTRREDCGDVEARWRFPAEGSLGGSDTWLMVACGWGCVMGAKRRAF